MMTDTKVKAKRIRLPESAKGKKGVELLEATMKFINRHPELHDQSSWATVDKVEEEKTGCGTSCCFAGWAVCLHYGRVPKSLFQFSRHENDARHHADFIKDDGAIQTEAMHLLGLSTSHADYLFSVLRDRKQLEGFVNKARKGDIALY